MLQFRNNLTSSDASRAIADVAGQIQQAINNAIAQHGKQVTAGVPVTTTNANGSPTVSVQTVTVTPSTTVVPSTVTVEGQESTVYVTQTITSLPPGATILPNSVSRHRHCPVLSPLADKLIADYKRSQLD